MFAYLLCLREGLETLTLCVRKWRDAPRHLSICIQFITSVCISLIRCSYPLMNETNVLFCLLASFPTPFYLQSDPVALMHGDMIRLCAWKLVKKKEKGNGFHARVVKWIEDYNLHGSSLIHKPQIQLIEQILYSKCNVIFPQLTGCNCSCGATKWAFFFISWWYMSDYNPPLFLDRIL